MEYNKDIKQISKAATVDYAFGEKYVLVNNLWYKIVDEDETTYYYLFQRL